MWRSCAYLVLRCQNGGASFKSTRDCQRPGMFMSDCEQKTIFLSDSRERVFTNAHVYLLMTSHDHYSHYSAQAKLKLWKPQRLELLIYNVSSVVSPFRTRTINMKIGKIQIRDRIWTTVKFDGFSLAVFDVEFLTFFRIKVECGQCHTSASCFSKVLRCCHFRQASTNLRHRSWFPKAGSEAVQQRNKTQTKVHLVWHYTIFYC